MPFLQDLKDDYRANNLILKKNAILTAFNILMSPKAWAITLIRLIVADIFFVTKISRFICYILFHIEIGSNVSIGPRTIFQHPTDIVIATGSIIGSDCSIYHRVTLAEKGGLHKGPNIGDNCVIGTGTVIVGDVSIW